MSWWLVVLCLSAAGPPQAGDEDLVRHVMQDYYAAQEAEDVDGVQRLWRTEAAGKPTREALTAVFATGDDRYSVTIRRLAIAGDEAIVRVAGERVRTLPHDGSSQVFRSTVLTSFTLARAGGTWQIVAERSGADEVIADLLAASPAERERLLSDPINSTAPVLQALASRASRLAIGQQYHEAQAVLEAALAAARVAGDQRSEGATLQNLANALYFQRDYARALEYYQQHLGLAREVHDQEGVAASLLGVATTRYARGDYTAALVSYREALTIYERSETAPAIGSTLISIGNVEFMQADYDASTRSYRRALTFLQAGVDPRAVAMAKAGLARVLSAQGDLAAALDLYSSVVGEARARARAGAPAVADLAATLESVGELHYRLGNTDQARAAFDEARKLSDDRHDPGSAGRLLFNLGLTELSAARPDPALADYVESRARFETAQQPEGVAHAWVGIGFSQTAREQYPAAIAAYRNAIASFESLHLPEERGRALLGLSFAQSDSGDVAAALDSARRAREIADASPNDELKWRSRVREGESLRKLARLDEAERAFLDAIGLIQRMLPDLAVSAEVRTQLDESATAWAGLAFTRGQRGDGAGALIAEERRRAHIRRLFLAPFERDIALGVAAADQDAERETVRDLVSVRAQLRAERSARRPDPVRAAELRRRLAVLTRARSDQQTALYSRLPTLAVWRGQELPSVAADLQTLLPAGLVVEFLVSDDELLVLSAQRGGAEPDVTAAIVPIKHHELAAKVVSALDSACLRDAALWRERATPLADLLLAPVAARLTGQDRLVLVPDDVLWRLPFEALPGGIDLAARSVTYGTSLIALAMMSANGGSSPSPSRDRATAPSLSFGALAGPVLAPPLQAQLAISAPAWKTDDAPEAIEASARLAALYGDASTLVSGAAATKAAAKDLLASRTVLHLAAPLQMSGANPLFSSVLLASAGDDDLGRWELREWFSGRGSVDVLSLPDGSTFGSGRAGAAIDALAWAAAASGVSTLVLGRDPAGAYSTDAIFTAFHERIARSTPPADALHAAIASARSTGGDAPSAWAGARMLGGLR